MGPWLLGSRGGTAARTGLLLLRFLDGPLCVALCLYVSGGIKRGVVSRAKPSQLIDWQYTNSGLLQSLNSDSVDRNQCQGTAGHVPSIEIPQRTLLLSALAEAYQVAVGATLEPLFGAKDIVLKPVDSPSHQRFEASGRAHCRGAAPLPPERSQVQAQLRVASSSNSCAAAARTGRFCLPILETNPCTHPLKSHRQPTSTCTTYVHHRQAKAQANAPRGCGGRRTGVAG